MGNTWATWFLRFPQQPIKRLPDSQSDPDGHIQGRAGSAGQQVAQVFGADVGAAGHTALRGPFAETPDVAAEMNHLFLSLHSLTLNDKLTAVKGHLQKENDMRHWTVMLTYLVPSCKWRRDAKLGVLAETAEESIAMARSRGVPEDATDVLVWSVHHQGHIDVAGE